MACFIVPAAEALITTAVTLVVEKKFPDKAPLQAPRRLSKLLWGGSALLAFEHFWHGEIQPFYPFLTAAQNPESSQVMIHEMSTVGVGMACMVTLAWAASLIFLKVRKPSSSHATVNHSKGA
ncbi:MULTISPECIES: hypothetical protein [unclassified Fibrobacter]|uniref:hypothetical protein n=1 Tax=unclassified Fibrobacter TaxID=2634177 RepID=UPI00091270F2|nr:MULTISPECIES: hypothetical protein [unclassified Fibrobacter]OWV03606.1 hypothetical protein B7993_12890 [Fibrobacter sp. UWH3]SHL62921.1 hypothetical protein SAMN05720765_11930 [Fibrobacter sp. UWH6]